MKLKVLVDNNTLIDEYYLGEPALSFYIEDDNTKILFDTAYSNIFLKNAKKMNIDLKNLDYIVLSHGHNDHTGGLKYLKNKDLSNVKLIAHKDVFIKRYENNIDISCPIKIDELNINKYIEGNKVIKITKNLYYLGPIKRIFPFENKAIGFRYDNKEDYLLDDSALVYKNKDGIFIITACSHSGICNIIEQAKKVCKKDNILGIIGGFHLLKDDLQLKETIKYLKKENIKDIYPCHCVCLDAKVKLNKISNLHEVGVGTEIIIK